ncbi:MAG: hypothetical protein ACK4S4_14800 [Pyrinomonadaceae bacterium]
MSTIEGEWTNRVIGTAQTPRLFLDFVIDGNSLYEQLYEKCGDFITPFGWLPSEETQKAINRLLLIDGADFADNRRSIYVCPECADLGCGAVSALIERVDNNIVWREFGIQNNYDKFVDLDSFVGLGPFVFDWREYERVIKAAAV